MEDDLTISVREALELLTSETGHDADALFGERVLDDQPRTATVAHALGLIEGAAIALGVTALELLDELGLPWGPAPSKR